ncbi:MAG: hypothetical protein CL943_03570 [Candidatus Diapherotrites archaeon]|uniref:Flavodoxin-like domain-containing protein n=1 Tax=Candidatus Iainarchaeum sp. TaxID=3101447 RepID=A0A2D6M1Q1_9ARCH|nr:hypothetical protein [Candidatus Diapherotrites archaeon]|tara:strand:- start:515 stop:1051 length:537 start_codon:yes stop_codon:yes gene_type:complete
MKIIAISGSSREGNTDAILKRILDGARENGASIELVRLRERNIELCDGCSSCEKTHHCHLLDEMQSVYKKVFDADVVVLGSPNYFNNVSALMKNFMDRFNPYWEDARLKNKKAVAVCVGGQSYDSIKYCEQAIEQFLKICSMNLIEKIWVTADRPMEAKENEELMQKCFELGKKLAEK